MALTLKELREKIEKKYADSTEVFPDLLSVRQTEVIKSRSPIVNAVTGIGGLPRARVVEIYGPFSSGKTTIAIDCAVSAQRSDPNAVVLYIDYEHAFEPIYARNLGLDLSPERFVFAQPNYFEQGSDIALMFTAEGLVDLIVIDSAAAMTPKSELSGVMDTDGGTQKGTQASLMARFLERITKWMSQGKKPCLILINQTRANIVIGGRPQKNAPREISAAGNAIKFYSSIRLELELLSSEGDENRGTKGIDQVYTRNRVRITAVKNKLAPPQMRGQLVFEYGKGINHIVSIADLAEAKLGIMSGAGYFNYNGRTQSTSFSCRGRDAFQRMLEHNQALLSEIEEAVLDKIKQETATALGLDEIKTSGQAKQLSENEVLLLEQQDDVGQGLAIQDVGDEVH